MKKVVSIFLLLCLAWGGSALDAFADNQRPARLNCTCTGFGNVDGFDVNQEVLGFNPMQMPFVVEVTELPDDEDDNATDPAADRLAIMLEIRLLGFVLEDMTLHMQRFANNELSDDSVRVYEQAADSIEADFRGLQRGAHYGVFMETLRSLIHDRQDTLRSEIDVTTHVDGEATVLAVNLLIDDIEGRVRDLTDEDDSRDVRFWHLIYDRVLYYLYKVAADGATLNADRSYRTQSMQQVLSQSRVDLLLVLDFFQYDFRTRFHLWLNRAILAQAETWVNNGLYILEREPVDALWGYQNLFQLMGGQGDFNTYRTRVGYADIRRDLHDYVNRLRNQMEIPDWSVLGVTQEELESNQEVVQDVLNRCLSVYVEVNARMQGENLVYIERLFVRAAISFLCEKSGMQQNQDFWLTAARRDIVRVLGGYPSWHMVSLNALPPGVHPFGDQGTIRIRLVPSRNGTRAANH